MIGLDKAKNWLLRWEWIILVCLATIAFVLGFIGYWNVLQAQDLPFSLSLIIYWTFQLFVLNVTFIPEQTNVLVEIARFLAPGLFFFAAIKAGWQILRTQIEESRIKRLKDHVIICGAGEKGFMLAEQFKKNKYNVVVIDIDAGNGLLQQCKEIGAYTIIGNVTDKQVLMNAGIERAGYLIAICGDDGVNAQIWVSVSETSPVKKRKKPLHCYIHIVNAPIFDNLREQELMHYTNPPLARSDTEAGQVKYDGNWACLHFFNTYENSAIKLLSLFPIDEDKQKEPHIMVIGLGNLAECFVIQTIKNWHNDQQKATLKRTLSVTIVDPRATSKTMLWSMRYPSLGINSRIVPLDIGVESVDFHSIFEKIDNKSLSKIYICMEDEVMGVTSTLIILQKIREMKRKEIILCTPHEKGIAQMISRVTSSGELVNPIQVFGFLKMSCNKDLLMASDIDIIAQALHQGYLTTQITEYNKGMGSEAVMQDWSKLADEHKNQNYRQAHSIHEMLLSQKYGIKPRCNWDELPIEFSMADIDIFCKKEHEKWKFSREQEGWTWGEVRDDKKHKNPLLKGWDELSEKEKNTTRKTIRNIPGYLAKTNYDIYKINSENSAE